MTGRDYQVLCLKSKAVNIKRYGDRFMDQILTLIFGSEDDC